jgi:predicted transposase/invertase (TIGR01784 family)
VQLKDHKNKLFYEKLKFVYLEMPHFVKEEHELETRLDKWLYFIKHLEDFESIPEIFKDTVFTLAFEKAEIANYNAEELKSYEQSLKIYRDLKNVIDTAMMEGEAIGEARGKELKETEKNIDFVKVLLTQTDFSTEKIANMVSVTVAFVEEVKASLSQSPN